MDLRHRPRRNRSSEAIRNLNQESRIVLEKLIEPIFLLPGENQKSEIKSMPGIFRFSSDFAMQHIEKSSAWGIKTFILFPVVPEALKDKRGSYSYSENNFYLQIIRKLREKFPELTFISDVALDPYSSDGHDGVVQDGQIVNDETVEILSKMAVAQAKAGIHIVGPSDMMDGRIGAIRDALDAAHYTDVAIMAYTAKYASAFYGPFRDALDSAPKWGDKKTYQMNPAARREALREARLDAAEGADYLMVKPALAYLDIISDLKSHFDLPIVCYNVSGEYAMVKAAAAANYLDGARARDEMLLSFFRAGADIVITYFAREFAESRA